jgi:mitochondrial chaperone BCS1
LPRRARYESLGIPWRRGYLLFGPPGTGKTSLVTALASELRLNVCALSLASSHLTDERIHSLMSSVPPRSALLIEDVDAFFREREQASAGMKLSFSGFLNALDGVATHEGSVLFMTTNRPERLDPAIVRAGRIDYRLELGLADRTQLVGMCLKFFPDRSEAEQFADALPVGVFSPARIQEALLNEADAAGAAKALATSSAAAAEQAASQLTRAV